jgi:hypothetical protein
MNELAAPELRHERVAAETPMTNSVRTQKAAVDQRAVEVAGKADEGGPKNEEVPRLNDMTVQGRISEDFACIRDRETLARLRGSLAQGWAREDLKRLQQRTPCDWVRSEAVALMNELAAPERRHEPVGTESGAGNQELMLSVRRELQRLGCFDGEEDGRPGDATMAAIKRYLLARGRSNDETTVTERLVADLRTQSTRVCLPTCKSGEHVEGDRCVADRKLGQEETRRPGSRRGSGRGAQ